MVPLIERGRALHAKYIESLDPRKRPIGGVSMPIVAEDDFIKHSALCARHVQRSQRPIVIVCEDGSLCMQLEPLSWTMHRI